MLGTKYSLRVVNQSSRLWDMCVYQVDPDLGVPDVMSLAWFTKSAHPSTNVTFTWTVDYSFVWAETGELDPGVLFAATQEWPADPSVVRPATSSSPGNQVGYTDLSGAYTFNSTPTPGAQPGSLYIKQDGTIPDNRSSVGIGMSGSGTFVTQAGPNINLTFTPHPVYYLAAGTYTQGEVLDIGAMTNPTDIRFPPNIYAMTAVLQPDNTWSVKPALDVNTRELARTTDELRDEMAALLPARRLEV